MSVRVKFETLGANFVSRTLPTSSFQFFKRFFLPVVVRMTGSLSFDFGLPTSLYKLPTPYFRLKIYLLPQLASLIAFAIAFLVSSCGYRLISD
jgi:hypothetical protein